MVGAWDVPTNPGGSRATKSVQRERPFTPSTPRAASPRPPPSPLARLQLPAILPRVVFVSSSTAGARGVAGASGPAPRRHGVGAGDDAGDPSGTAAGVSPAWDGRGAGPSPSAAQRFSVDMRRFSSRGARASVNINLGQTQPSRDPLCFESPRDQSLSAISPRWAIADREKGIGDGVPSSEWRRWNCRLELPVRDEWESGKSSAFFGFRQSRSVAR